MVVGRQAQTHWEDILWQVEQLGIGEGMTVKLPGSGRQEAKQLQSVALELARKYGDRWKVKTSSIRNNEVVVVHISKVAKA